MQNEIGIDYNQNEAVAGKGTGTCRSMQEHCVLNVVYIYNDMYVFMHGYLTYIQCLKSSLHEPPPAHVANSQAPPTLVCLCGGSEH